MPAATYRIPDEPLPSAWSRQVVDPMWPLLAVMLAGNAVGLAWFVFNGIAMGSPGRRTDWLWAVASLLLALLVWLGLGALLAAGVLDERSVRYAALLPVVVKLAVAYRLYLGQTASHELWDYYGGQSRNGMVPLVLMTLLLPVLWRSQAWPPLLLQVLR